MGINKSKSAFKTIAEVADELGVAPHVLRFWETKFNQIKPMKATGGRRYYRPDDVEVIKLIQTLLYQKRYTIEGAQQYIKEKGLKSLLGNEEIQKDFFADSLEENIVEEVKNTTEISESHFNENVARGIASAIDDLKALRKKLSGL